MHFPPGFDEAGVMLTWGAEASELVFGVLTNNVNPWIFVESVSL